MTKDELKNRTKLFAHNCVKLALDLPKNILGNILLFSSQIYNMDKK